MIRNPKNDVRKGVRRRYCSRVRWPRFPQLAFRPHPSRHGHETASSQPVHCQKQTFGEAFGEAFGAATGVSDPRLHQLRIRNHHADGRAATVAGYDGPGFHTWPPSHIPQDTDTKPLLRSRASATAKKTFGEAFGAATGVSDPRLQQIRIRNHHTGGQAATVAGYDGPGFHNWPSSHIPQDTDTKPLLRSRSTAKKTFGEAFGAATGVSDPRLQKIRIRDNYAGKLTSLSSTDPTPSVSGPEGASHTSPGCQPLGIPGKTTSRSEGTPHSLRVSDVATITR